MNAYFNITENLFILDGKTYDLDEIQYSIYYDCFSHYDVIIPCTYDSEQQMYCGEYCGEDDESYPLIIVHVVITKDYILPDEYGKLVGNILYEYSNGVIVGSLDVKDPKFKNRYLAKAENTIFFLKEDHNYTWVADNAIRISRNNYPNDRPLFDPINLIAIGAQDRILMHNDNQKYY